MPCDHPAYPIPDPLRGNDGRQNNGFTYTSIVQRLPEIAGQMLANNNFSRDVVAGVEALIKEIPYGSIRPLIPSSAPDADDWSEYCAPYLSQNWLEAPWFFVETYFYKRILEATGYYQPGQGQGVDPFKTQKQQGLNLAIPAVRGICRQLAGRLSKNDSREEMLETLLAIDLWGNQADLSMWPAGSDEHPAKDSSQQKDFTLVDDRKIVSAHVLTDAVPIGRIDFILDNAGFELAVDLLLATVLLAEDLAQVVQLHAKPHPTFVSDAIKADIESTVSTLAGDKVTEVAFFGRMLQEFISSGRVRVLDDWFWTSPLAMWEMPAALGQSLAPAKLILCKGDANYRRLLGDRHWPFTTPFNEVVCYLPAPTLALRTSKSEVAIGLTPGQVEKTSRKDPDWLVNGQWGFIQFVK